MQLKFIKDVFKPYFAALTVGKEYKAYSSSLSGSGFYVFDDRGEQHHFSGLKNGPDKYGFDPADCWEQV